MNSENRAKALAELAIKYEVDPKSLYEATSSGQFVAYYLDRADLIARFVEVVSFPGEYGLDGEQLYGSYFALRADVDEPGQAIAEAERESERENLGSLVAIADLDSGRVIRPGGPGWSFDPQLD